MKLTATITGDKSIRADLARLGTFPRLALDRTAEEVEEYIEQEAGKHSKDGKLFASIYKRRTADGWEIGHDLQVARHALFVHWGAKPHVIRPKGASLATQRELFGENGTQRGRTAAGKLKPMPKGRKLVLRWPMGGRFIFAQFVNHPGYKGDPWLVRAAARAPQIFQRHLDALMARSTTSTAGA